MEALTIDTLKKTYSNGFEALKGVSFAIEQGDFFALLGPNGAGKSTTIGIVASLVNKTSGSIKVFGYDLDTQKNLVKQCIGLVPQEFNFNVFEKVENIILQQAGYYGIEYSLAKERAEKYLKKLELWDKRMEAGRNLSGGMKRRLMIARAMVHEPKLLVLDEPTAGVDVEIRHSMWEFIKEINEKGTTIILTTHYLEEVEALCKNVAIIDQGKILTNTSLKNLLRMLDRQTFVMDLQSKVAHIPKMDQAELTLVDPTTVELTVPKDMVLNDIFSQLSDQNIKVLSMRSKSNRLETLFLDLVHQGKSS
ncbi:MAG: ABC transporter ATP-binding protein [Oligoflexales bacterium]|nr:ABC transporter ATP-binding protein [Oligoflexales bacterium]